MHFIKHLNLFTKKNFIQLRRKWISLPLLLFFPILLVGLVLTIIVALISPDSEEPIQVGLVDLDQSEESTLVLNLISESSHLGPFLQIENMTEPEAINRMKNDQLSAYITFPNNFTANLYEGEPVSLPIIGNAKRPTESYLIKEIIDSVTRHISASQANILTINYYAKELPMDSETRSDMLFEQFKDFLVYAFGKDKVIDLEELTNHATASPINYYGLASWFIITTIWLLLLYNFLFKKETMRMKKRMKLYGVTEFQEIISKIIVALIVTAILSIGAFIGLKQLLDLDLITEDFIRIALIMLLYGFVYLQCLAIIEMIVKSDKIRLLSQSILTVLLLIVSGTIMPIIYFPLKMQSVVPYSFSNQAFFGLQEIILNERFYANYTSLLLMSTVGLFVLIGLSNWKERVFK